MLHQLGLSLQFALDAKDAVEHRAALPRHAVARWIRHALACDAQITVRIVGETEGRALNRDYRRKDYATNVLTFAYVSPQPWLRQAPQGGARKLGSGPAFPHDDPPLSADLVLCAPVVAREARELGRTLQAHYAHLIVHGSLHAQGWDHETGAADARRMEARETEVLAGLGFANPYA